MRRLVISLSLVLLVVAAGTLWLAKRDILNAKESRPAGVPAEAILRDEFKAPHYIFCEVVRGGLCDCTVYGMYRAFPVVRGYYWLSGGVTFSPHEASEYVDFDGTNIELTHHRTLVLVEPRRPSGVPFDAVWGGAPQCGGFAKCTQSGEHFDCTRYDERTGEARTREYLLEGDAGATPPSEWPLRGLCPVPVSDVWLSPFAHLVEKDSEASAR